MVKSRSVHHQAQFWIENDIAVDLIIIEQGIGFVSGRILNDEQFIISVYSLGKSRVLIKFLALDHGNIDLNKFLGIRKVGKGQVEQGG